MLEVADLIAVVAGDTTAHEVRQRARRHNCGAKGNNTYKIVHKGAFFWQHPINIYIQLPLKFGAKFNSILLNGFEGTGL